MMEFDGSRFLFLFLILGGFSAAVEGLKWINGEWGPPKEKKAYDSVLLACRNQYKWEEVGYDEQKFDHSQGFLSKGCLRVICFVRLKICHPSLCQ